MANITINPADVIELKTPLYREEDNKVYKLLPETAADQVKLANGQNAETKIASLDSNISSAQSTAGTALANANTAITNAGTASATAQAAQDTASSAYTTAISAKSIAESAQATANSKAGTNVATQSANGLMSASDKTLIDKAKQAGQLGDLPYLGEIDANTLIETGEYFVNTMQNTYANHWPKDSGSKTFVKVCRNSTYITQEVVSPWDIWERRGSIGNNNIVEWVVWKAVYLSKSSLTLYLSKNGSDSNTGLSPDYPILTVNRAIEIISALRLNMNDSNHVYLRFGAGDWGDVNIIKLPHVINIMSYDNNTHTEYSDELPKFNRMVIQGQSFVYIKNCIIKNLIVDTCSYCNIYEGYKRINYICVNNNSFFRMYHNTNIENVWEIGNSRESDSGVILVDYSSTIFISGKNKIKLIENNTANYFLYLSYLCKAWIGITCEYLLNGFTFSGGKVYALQGSNLASDNVINNLDTMPLVLSKMFGTTHFVHKGASINNFVFTGQW